jgi:hypothetical protein
LAVIFRRSRNCEIVMTVGCSSESDVLSTQVGEDDCCACCILIFLQFAVRQKSI